VHRRPAPALEELRISRLPVLTAYERLRQEADVEDR